MWFSDLVSLHAVCRFVTVNCDDEFSFPTRVLVGHHVKASRSYMSMNSYFVKGGMCI